MIRILSYKELKETEKEAVFQQTGQLSPHILKEIRFHQDVIPESALFAFASEKKTGLLAANAPKKAELLGLGVLMRNPADTYVSLEFDVDVRDSRGVDAAVGLMNHLMDCFDSLHEEEPEKYGTLRMWCKKSDTALLEFLNDCGFSEKNEMLKMRKAFEPEKTASEPFEMLDLLRESEMEEYLNANAEGFGIPDSPNEMRFRIFHCQARVFGVKSKDRMIACVTVWPEKDGWSATENVFCRTDFRRQGITSGLLLAVHQMLRKEGAVGACLNVYADDEPAIRMYEKIGYRETGRLVELHYQ